MNSSFNWIKASRPQTLIASLAPIIPTSILCFKQNYFKIEIFFTTLIAGLMLQILANFINDLYDFKKGSDRDDRIGPERMVQTGKITEKEMKNGIFAVFLSCQYWRIANIGNWHFFIHICLFIYRDKNIHCI